MDAIRLIKDVRNEALSRLLSLLPIDNKKIVFDSYIGQGYKGNPKYIAEEILRQGLDYDLVWLVVDENTEFPEGIRKVKYASLQSFIELATAKLWIFDCRGVFHPRKRKNQIYIQTWHSPYGSKKSEKEAEDTLPDDYIKQAKEDGRITTAIISDGDALTRLYIDSFWLNENTEILKFGLPRNDILIKASKDENKRKEIRKAIGVKEDAYLVMFEPTFRDDGSLKGYQLDFPAVRGAFEELTGKECYIGVRLHPVVRQKSDNIVTFDEHIINLTYYPDEHELSIAGDAIISDYSTIAFDFKLLHKPVFICALDLENYEEKRGLNEYFYNSPFPLLKTNDELLNDIKSFDKDEYEKQVNKYFEMYPIYDEGDASKKTVEWIKSKISV